MRTFVPLLLAFVSVLTLSAQNISVTDFRLDEMDLTANQQGTTVMDQNGEKCALIKVITTQTGFTFDVGSLGVRKVEQKAGEIWVYIPHGVRKMSISHPQIGQLRDYTFPLTIARSRTYVMQLTTGEVQTVVKKSVTSQYVMFSVTPKNAVVELDGQIIEAIDGIASKRLPFGTYNYKVLSPRYSQATGTVTVNDPKNKHVVNVVLQPQFSNFTFEVANNAEIWIDDQKKGTGRCTVELGYGTYMVETRLAGHRNAQQEMTLSKENGIKTITLKAPTPIYGSLDINSTPGNATVLLDNKQIGTTPMYIDECLIGKHELEIKREGYKDFVTTVTVIEGETANAAVTLKKGSVSASPNLNKEFGSNGNVFTVNGISFAMIPVKGGSFIMGATSEITNPYEDEKPAHRVTLKSYYIGETEVTQDLWQIVMGSNPSTIKGERNPVENVSWHDCQTFLNKLNQITGKKFRLPTEAEWEYAARGGIESHHTQYSGSSNIDDVAWQTSNSGRVHHPVKTKNPNELGVYDMSGNVREWCQDEYAPYNSGSHKKSVSAMDFSNYVNRGGGWYDNARNCRLSYRSFNTPDVKVGSLGFRLALTK